MNMWREILTSILTSGIITGIFIFIINKWVEYSFDTKLEAYKDKLESASSERNIKLTRVFEDQASTIAQIYANLVVIINSLQNYTTLFEIPDQPTKEKRRKQVAEDIDIFLRHYKPRRIYLPITTQKTIEQFLQKLYATTNDHTYEVVYQIDVNNKMPDYETLMKAFNYLNGECNETLKNLDAEFKKILGMSEKV